MPYPPRPIHRRPAATPVPVVRPAPLCPLPDPHAVFLEPVYMDGLPYEDTIGLPTAPDEVEDEELAAA